MTKVPVVYRCFVESGSGGNINFDADDGLDAGLGRFFIKLDGTEHGAVIGGSHRMHAELCSALQQVVDANGTIQKAVLGVHVEMDKIRDGFLVHGIIYFLAGYGLRVTGYGLRVTGYGLRVAGCALRVAGCALRVAGHKS